MVKKTSKESYVRLSDVEMIVEKAFDKWARVYHEIFLDGVDEFIEIEPTDEEMKEFAKEIFKEITR